MYTAVGETVQGITATEYDCNITEVGTYSVHVRAESSSEYYTQGDIACSENNGMTYKYMVNLAPPASASISAVVSLNGRLLKMHLAMIFSFTARLKTVVNR